MKVTTGSSCYHSLDLVLCGQEWISDVAQPWSRESFKEQKDKAPRKGPYLVLQ